MTAPTFNSKEELQAKVDDYFKKQDKEQRHTVSGLTLHLGFQSRQSLYNYEAKKEYLDIIKKARLRIEGRLEELLYYSKANKDVNMAGIMLGLKTHYGYTDRQVDNGANRETPLTTDTPPTETREQWEARQKAKARL
jgi:hypothetical protein